MSAEIWRRACQQDWCPAQQQFVVVVSLKQVLWQRVCSRGIGVGKATAADPELPALCCSRRACPEELLQRLVKSQAGTGGGK